MQRKLCIETLQQRKLLAGDPIDVLDRAAVVAAYKQQYKPFVDVPVEWTGDVATCNAGTTSERTLDASLKVLNYIRNMSGLQSVSLDPNLNDKAREAALMMQAQGQLSHHPDSTWACYSEDGDAAAGKSNLFLGVTGPRAIVGYVEDRGRSNIAVGHRRWIQYPYTDRMGSGSTSNANALYVIGTGGVDQDAPEWVSWPPQGYVPTELVFPRWSVSHKEGDFQNANVQMSIAGQSVPITIHPVSNGFGLNTLVWEPLNAIDFGGAEEISIEISVTDVLIEGDTRSLKYEVMPIHPGPTVQTIQAARDDRFGTSYEKEFFFNLLANDDLEHEGWNPVPSTSIEAVVVDPPDNGRLSPALNSPGVLFYKPSPGFFGVDEFTYRMSNVAEGRVSNVATTRIFVLANSNSPWQNPRQMTDANFDGETTALDALLIVNLLDRHGASSVQLQVDDPTETFPLYFVDVNGNGVVSATDALDVINQLDLQRSGSSESIMLADSELVLLDWKPKTCSQTKSHLLYQWYDAHPAIF